MSADRTNLWMPTPFVSSPSGTASIVIARMYFVITPSSGNSNLTWTIAPAKVPSDFSIPWGNQNATNPAAATLFTNPPTYHYCIDDLPPKSGIYETKDWTFTFKAVATCAAGLGNTWTADVYAKFWKYQPKTSTWTRLSPANVPTLDWQNLGALFTSTPATSPTAVAGSYTFTPSSYLLTDEEVAVELDLKITNFNVRAVSGNLATFTITNPTLSSPTGGTWMETGHFLCHRPTDRTYI